MRESRKRRNTNEDRYRRHVLHGAGAVGLAGLAGCLGGDDDDGDDDDDANGTDDDETGGDPEPANFTVTDPNALDVERGEEINVDATIENTGEEEGTQTIRFLIDDDEADSRELTLEGGESESVSFSAETADFEAGEYDYEIATDDDAAGGTVEVTAIDADDPLFSFETGDVLSPGANAVGGELVNSYSLTVEDGELSLSAPEGWEVTEDGDTTFEIDPSGSIDIEWEVDVPDDVDPDAEYELTANVAYSVGGEEVDFEVDHQVTVFIEEAEQFYWSAAEYGVEDTPEDSWEPQEGVAEWAIQEDDDGQYMGFSGESEGTASHLRFVEAPEAVDVEVYATLKSVADESGDYWTYVRSPNETEAGPDGGTQQFRADCQLAGDAHRMWGYDGGGHGTLGEIDHVAGPDQLYHMRFQYHGDTMRARWWLPDEDEPEEWDMEFELDTEVQIGHTGVAYWSGAPFRVYEFGVGTGNENAPDGQA